MKHHQIAVSVAFFTDRELNQNFLRAFFFAASHTVGLPSATHLLIHDNGATQEIKDHDKIAELLKGFESMLGWTTTYSRSTFNVGFGEAHNSNLKRSQSDLFLVLNNDLTFPDLDFLIEMKEIFSEDQRVGAIGAIESPHAFVFSSGASPIPDSIDSCEIDYLEGSILALRTIALPHVGGLFSSKLAFFFFEDSDLSLRMKLNGWHLRAIGIPHVHRRSSPTRALPRQLLKSITERNRSVFLTLWGHDLLRRKWSRKVYFEIASLGMGDNLLACLVARQEIDNLMHEGFEAAYIYLRTPDLSFLFEDLSSVIILDKEPLLTENFDRIYAMSDLDYNSTDHLFDCIATHWCVDANWEKAKSAVCSLLPEGHNLSLPEQYAVVHIALPRKDWEGRYPHASFSQLVITHCQKQGVPVILVGDGEIFGPELTLPQVHDWRQRLSLVELFLVIAKASFFIGPDSGPMHIAQLGSVPSFVVFGATLAGARMRESVNSWTFRVSALDCAGCYHRYPGLGMNKCIRLDQACMNNFDEPQLESMLKAFLAGGSASWTAESQDMRRVRSYLSILRKSPSYHTLELDPVFDSRLSNEGERLRKYRVPSLPRSVFTKNQADEIRRLQIELSLLKRRSVVAFIGGPPTDTEDGPVGRQTWAARELAWSENSQILNWNGSNSAFGVSETADPQMTVRRFGDFPQGIVFDHVEVSLILFSTQATRTLLFWTGQPGEPFTGPRVLIQKVSPGISTIRFLISGSKISALRFDPIEYRGEFYIDAFQISAWSLAD